MKAKNLFTKANRRFALAVVGMILATGLALAGIVSGDAVLALISAASGAGAGYEARRQREKKPLNDQSSDGSGDGSDDRRRTDGGEGEKSNTKPDTEPVDANSFVTDSAERTTDETMNENTTDASGGDSTENIDGAIQDLSTEAQEALHGIEDAVAAAESASDEVTDVAEPVANALSDLSQGDRAGAVQAAMVLFSNDTAPEIAEARSAALAALAEGQEAADEASDVVDVLAKQASSLADALDETSVADKLSSAF